MYNFTTGRGSYYSASLSDKYPGFYSTARFKVPHKGKNTHGQGWQDASNATIFVPTDRIRDLLEAENVSRLVSQPLTRVWDDNTVSVVVNNGDELTDASDRIPFITEAREGYSPIEFWGPGYNQGDPKDLRNTMWASAHYGSPVNGIDITPPKDLPPRPTKTPPAKPMSTSAKPKTGQLYPWLEEQLNKGVPLEKVLDGAEKQIEQKRKKGVLTPDLYNQYMNDLNTFRGKYAVENLNDFFDDIPAMPDSTMQREMPGMAAAMAASGSESDVSSPGASSGSGTPTEPEPTMTPAEASREFTGRDMSVGSDTVDIPDDEPKVVGRTPDGEPIYDRKLKNPKPKKRRTRRRTNSRSNVPPAENIPPSGAPEGPAQQGDTPVGREQKAGRYLDEFLEYASADKMRMAKTGAMGLAIAGINAASDLSVPGNIADTLLSTAVGLAAAKSKPGHGRIIGPMAALATTTVLDPIINTVLPKAEPKPFNPYTGGYYYG